MKIKSSHFTSSRRETLTPPDASLPPHLEHLRRQKRERAPRHSRAAGGARVNEIVEFVRSLDSPARKRGGARYGPSPKNPPNPSMRSPSPMMQEQRAAIYATWTARQVRQFDRMSKRRFHRGVAGVRA